MLRQHHEQMFAGAATILCMNKLRMKVLVSRPRAKPAPAPVELRRPDFCWTRSGEILAPLDIPCADADTCGCGWAFAGVTSIRATSWGVVELRPVRQIVSEVEAGKNLAGNPTVEEFVDHMLARISDISRRIRPLPIGTIVGIWVLTPECFSLYPRPRRWAPERSHRATDDGQRCMTRRHTLRPTPRYCD